MAPRRVSLPDTTSGGKVVAKSVRPLHRVVVKQRPDEYCCKIKDLVKRGRKVGKVSRLREADVMKYVKVKKELSASSPLSRVSDVEVEESVDDHTVFVDMNRPIGIKKESKAKLMIDDVGVHSKSNKKLLNVHENEIDLENKDGDMFGKLLPSESDKSRESNPLDLGFSDSEDDSEEATISKQMVQVVEEICVKMELNTKIVKDLEIKLPMNVEIESRQANDNFEKEESKDNETVEKDLFEWLSHASPESDDVETSTSSMLGLVLTDSDDGDYDSQENDIVCNLVEEEQKIPKRVSVLKSSKRKEKLKFGFSKFEMRHDTRNLDRFFRPKQCYGSRFRRQHIPSMHRKDPDVVVNVDLIDAIKPVDVDDGGGVNFEADNIVEVNKLLTINESTCGGRVSENNSRKENINVNVSDKLQNVETQSKIEQEMSFVGDANGIIEEDIFRVEPFSIDKVEEALNTKDQSRHKFPKEALTEDPKKNNSSGEVFIEKLLNEKTVAANDEPYKMDTMDVGCDSVEVELDLNISELGLREEIHEAMFKDTKEEGGSAASIHKDNSNPSPEEQQSSVAVDDKIAEVISESGTNQECPEVEAEYKVSDMQELGRGIVLGRSKDIVQHSRCSAEWTLTAKKTRCDRISVSCDLSSELPESVAPADQPGQESSASSQDHEGREDVELSRSDEIRNELNPTKSEGNSQNTSADLPPPNSLPLNSSLSQLLTPGAAQLHSYLADAVVSDMDMEVFAKLDTSDPDVIFTEVLSAVDSENNIFDEESKENRAEHLTNPKVVKNVKTDKLVLKKEKFDTVQDAVEDSDSDVVLLSDDETDLCCPSLSSWQSDILSQTWQAWPVPDKDIVLHLGQDTGLSEDFVLAWYHKRTDRELEMLWDEL